MSLGTDINQIAENTVGWVYSPDNKNFRYGNIGVRGNGKDALRKEEEYAFAQHPRIEAVNASYGLEELGADRINDATVVIDPIVIATEIERTETVERDTELYQQEVREEVEYHPTIEDVSDILGVDRERHRRDDRLGMMRLGNNDPTIADPRGGGNNRMQGQLTFVYNHDGVEREDTDVGRTVAEVKERHVDMNLFVQQMVNGIDGSDDPHYSDFERTVKNVFRDKYPSGHSDEGEKAESGDWGTDIAVIFQKDPYTDPSRIANNRNIVLRNSVDGRRALRHEISGEPWKDIRDKMRNTDNLAGDDY